MNNRKKNIIISVGCMCTRLLLGWGTPHGNTKVEPTGRRPGDMAPAKLQIDLHRTMRTVWQQYAIFALPWRMHVKGIAWESFVTVLKNRSRRTPTLVRVLLIASVHSGAEDGVSGC